MNHLVKLFILLALVFTSATASAQITLNTGVDASNAVLDKTDADPRWEFDGSPAEVIDANGSWIDENGISKWLDGEDGGEFSITFELTATEAAGGRIDGRLGIDDYVDEIRLNDSQINVPKKINSANDEPWGDWVDISIESGFVAGTNTLTFVLEDVGKPGGFRAELEFSTAGGYEFADSCVPHIHHDLTGFTPDATIMVGLSTSMDDSSGVDLDGDTVEETRIEIVGAAVADVASSNHYPGTCTVFSPDQCDPVRLGLGYFAIDLMGLVGLESMMAVGSSEDSGPAIVSNLGGAMVGGDRAIGAAVNELDTGDNPLAEDINIVITDGVSTNDDDLRLAIDAACNIRNRGDSVYLLGFGPDPNIAALSAVAAAGGTGMCCDGASAPCGNGDRIDPCADVNAVMRADNTLETDIDCSGAIATDHNNLKPEIVDILETGECTFELQIPVDYPDNKAFEDPAATLVRVKLPYLAGGWVDLPNAGDPTRNLADELAAAYGSTYPELDSEGWEFTDSGRDEIRFTDELCKMVRRRELIDASTQLACTCTKAGAGCSFTLDASFLGFSTYQLERLRCTEGVYQCTKGKDKCSGTANAMPEICNGFDDDCDGVVDNMQGAQTEWQPYIDSGADPEGLHCGYVNTCACETPGYYDPPSSGVDIENHKSSWTGVCECSENLLPDFSAIPAEPVGADAPEPAPNGSGRPAAGGCSSSGGGAGAPALLLLLSLGIVGRRRRPN